MHHYKSILFLPEDNKLCHYLWFYVHSGLEDSSFDMKIWTVGKVKNRKKKKKTQKPAHWLVNLKKREAAAVFKVAICEVISIKGIIKQPLQVKWMMFSYWKIHLFAYFPNFHHTLISLNKTKWNILTLEASL